VNVGRRDERAARRGVRVRGDVHGGRPVDELALVVDHPERQAILADREDRAREPDLGGAGALDLGSHVLQRLAFGGREVGLARGLRRPHLLLEAAVLGHLADGVLGRAAVIAAAGQ
jgi:hypothetical protein